MSRPTRSLPSSRRLVVASAAAAVAITAGACKPQPVELPFPSKEKAAKRIESGIQNAEEEAARKRQAAEDASK